GLYVMPHGIRVDPDGNVWTTDAATSLVRKFDPRGTLLLTIEVGGLPSPCPQNFCGTTDLAFGPGGRIFVADGYANARLGGVFSCGGVESGVGGCVRCGV